MELITILGPTAVGKTKLAVALANAMDGEVISADSRQIYTGMDIGTGKDLSEYKQGDLETPFHLINIRKAGEKYDVFNFQRDFYNVLKNIRAREKVAVLCGGTGLYIQAALDDKTMLKVPENKELRKVLEKMSQEELNEYLLDLEPLQHNTTDLTDAKRTIRAIEIIMYQKANSKKAEKSPVTSYRVFGLELEREKLRKRIAERLDARLAEGMVEEVERLKQEGLNNDQLNYYGLEYRFINQYLNKELDFETMRKNLLQAIRRFAKKQMTWYRRMERKGVAIHWLSAEKPVQENLKEIRSELHTSS